MQITINIDTKPIKRLAERMRRSPVLVGSAAAVLLGLSSYAYAISTSPTNVFVDGQVTSAADINTNFDELYAAASTNEADIVTLQSDVSVVETSVGSLETSVGSLTSSVAANANGISDLASQTTNACAWYYKFASVSPDQSNCPANTFVMSGSCIVHGTGSVARSSPVGIAGGAGTPVESGTGWSCTRTGGTSMDIRALCCPL